MEIIYLVFVVFMEGNLVSLQMHAWHEYAPAEDVAEHMSCAAAIQQPEFQERLARTLRAGQTGQLSCKGGSQLGPLASLVEDARSVTIQPVASPEQTQVDEQQSVASVKLTGHLIHQPYDASGRSVAAYLGQEFFLETKDRGRVALYPTDAITKKDLMKWRGKSVTVRAIYVDHTPKASDDPMSYPADQNGAPLKRAGYEVRKIDAAASVGTRPDL
jgi:hypothetical protein